MRRLRELLLPKKFPSPLTLLRHESEAESQNFSPLQSHTGTVNFGFEPRSCLYLGDKVLSHAWFCPFQTGNDNADQAEGSDLQSTVTQRLGRLLFAYVPIYAALTAMRASVTQPLQPTHVYVHFAKALYAQPFHPGTTQTLQRAAASFPTPPSALQTNPVSTHRSHCPGALHTAKASPAAQHRPSSSCKAHQGLWLFHNISTLQAFKKKKNLSMCVYSSAHS